MSIFKDVCTNVIYCTFTNIFTIGYTYKVRCSHVISVLIQRPTNLKMYERDSLYIYTHIFVH